MLDILNQGLDTIRDMVFDEPEEAVEETTPIESIKQPILPADANTEFSFEISPEPEEEEFGIQIDENQFVSEKKPKANSVGFDPTEDNSVKETKESAKKSYFEYLQKTENPSKKGYKNGKFSLIESQEGKGKDKGMSKFEIGYGIKVPESWLSSNKKKWPKINGVHVDVRKGLTEDQVNSYVRDLLPAYEESAKKKLKKEWDSMSENEKLYWTDLSYNGGKGAIDENPTAKRVTNNGHTIEGIIRTFDYIKMGSIKGRGLLRRRLNMYNKAAVEHNGVPIVEEYVFGDKIKVKFSSAFNTDLVSKSFANKIKKNKGWFVVSKGGTKGDKIYKHDNLYFK